MDAGLRKVAAVIRELLGWGFGRLSIINIDWLGENFQNFAELDKYEGFSN